MSKRRSAVALLAEAMLGSSTIGNPGAPTANDSREAIALREAAIEFARHDPDKPPRDPDDKRGQRLNWTLLARARAYAKVADAS